MNQLVVTVNASARVLSAPPPNGLDQINQCDRENGVDCGSAQVEQRSKTTVQGFKSRVVQDPSDKLWLIFGIMTMVFLIQILLSFVDQVAVKFVPCEDLLDFAQRHGGRIDEVLARVIMQQATQAAYMSCQRGVLHRDIKQENLLINKDTLEVKLIEFGCGDLLQSMAYTTFMGTPMYCPPEFLSQGKYHGETATVYSLGVLLFSLICGTFPDSHDKSYESDLNR
ncbi:hypothetical protein cypCar_00006338 [Cyprinus carpio]|nr:hypothetical protein cypCar_00006338 [Cyprinus carpio]